MAITVETVKTSNSLGQLRWSIESNHLRWLFESENLPRRQALSLRIGQKVLAKGLWYVRGLYLGPHVWKTWLQKPVHAPISRDGNALVIAPCTAVQLSRVGSTCVSCHIAVLQGSGFPSRIMYKYESWYSGLYWVPM